MKAMVFAAGLGTRLRPYTNDRPKALVEINGHSLLAITLKRIKSAGIKEVVVNVHHYANLIIEHLKKHDNFGLEITISDETDCLLETGGGLLKAQKWLNDAPFLVHNVDIISDLDLNDLVDFHLSNEALATLAVRERATSRYLEFNQEKLLSGWKNIKTGERKTARKSDWTQHYAFSGISVFNPEIFSFFPKEERSFSIIPVLLKAAKTQKITAYPHSDTLWMDVGKPETLEKAAKILNKLSF